MKYDPKWWNNRVFLLAFIGGGALLAADLAATHYSHSIPQTAQPVPRTASAAEAPANVQAAFATLVQDCQDWKPHISNQLDNVCMTALNPDWFPLPQDLLFGLGIVAGFGLLSLAATVKRWIVRAWSWCYQRATRRAWTGHNPWE